MRNLGLTDFDFKKQIDIISSEFKKELLELFDIRRRYLADPYKPEIVHGAYKIKEKIRKRLLEEHPLFDDALFYPLEFFFCYFDENGEPLPEDKWGFDGIISNPPWEVIKPVKKEFAKLGKYEMDYTAFESVFSKSIQDDANFKERWQNYNEQYDALKNYCRGKYIHQGNGDLNFYKLFLERDFQLIKDKAFYCLLVPSGFQTDEGSSKLRSLLIQDNHLLELSSFENRGYHTDEQKNKIKLFPEVHPQFKFSILFSMKEKIEEYSFKSKFYLQNPNELYNDKFVIYNLEKIRDFSPDNLSIMEFQSNRDYLLCSKIKSDFDIFSSIYPIFKREYHMTDDNHLFKKPLKVSIGSNLTGLYEDKSIHQFTSNYSILRYYIFKKDFKEDNIRRAIFKLSSDLKVPKEEAKDIFSTNALPLEQDFYRLVYRAIGSSTNERTMISTILPKNVASVNSLNVLIGINYLKNGDEVSFKRIQSDDLILLTSFLNSLTLNYYLRNKISANLNMFYIYELPIATADNETKQRIVELGFSLLYRKSKKEDFEDLKIELGVEVDSDRELVEIRAELEVIIAKKLYKLDKSDWDYLTSTFVYGNESKTKIELDEIIRISKVRWDVI